MAQLYYSGIDTDDIIITTCDSDTKFHPEFLNALGEKLIRCLIIEPDAPNILKAEPDWMKNGEMVADSA